MLSKKQFTNNNSSELSSLNTFLTQLQNASTNLSMQYSLHSIISS